VNGYGPLAGKALQGPQMHGGGRSRCYDADPLDFNAAVTGCCY